MIGKALALIIALLALTIIRIRRWTKRREDIRLEEHVGKIPHGAFSHTILIGGVRIHYQEKGTGPTLALIHGFCASSYTWREVFEPLSQKFRVIAMDLKGFGFSDKPQGNYKITTQVDLIEKFLRKRHIEKATFCGNSMGGAISLLMAIRRPEIVERIILVDSASFTISRSLAPQIILIPKLGEALGAVALNSDYVVQRVLNRCYYNTALISKEQIAAYHRPLITKNGQRAVFEAGREFNAELRWLGSYILENGKRIAKPTLIVWGEDDKIIPVENAHRLHAAIPQSKLVILEKCGHIPQEEQPKQFLEAVLQFLQSNIAGGQAGSYGSDVESAKLNASRS